MPCALAKAVLATLFALLAGFANAQTAGPELPGFIEADASENYFYIEPGFDGTDVVIFGAIDRDRFKGDSFDLAITIVGPVKPMTVWKKERRGPIWVNSRKLKFDAVPSYYSVLTTKPVEALASSVERAKYEIGLDVLDLPIKRDAEGSPVMMPPDEFRSGLIRLKKASRLFLEDSYSIEMLGRSLFRARTFLPASGAPGLYRARIFLIQHGKVIGSTTSHVRLTKVGIEDFLSSSSSASPWLYGVCAVLLAAAIGGGASLVFRKS